MLDDGPGLVRVLHLANDALAISVLPECGAKIFDLVDKTTGQNFLWHNPRILPRQYPVDANFDNYWCGGWDDGFPTCESCTHKGELYPNIGELRSVTWRVEHFDVTSVHLSAYGPINPVRAEKRLTLRGGTLEMEYTIHHEGYAPIDFLWGTHPAFAIEPGCRIRIPSRSALVAQANPERFGEAGRRYEWPTLETRAGFVDMSLVPEPADYNAGHYVLDCKAGWYAIEFPNRQSGVLIEFPLDVCPHLWLWLSYGGWRGYYLAVIEPWTGVPVTLSDAVAAGTHSVLQPGATFRVSIKATPWHNPVNLAQLLAERGFVPSGEISK